MPRVKIKIHEFSEAAHKAREPLPVLDTIEIDEAAHLGSDEGKAAARKAVEAHTSRRVRTISHVKGGGYAAIVPPR